MSHQPHDAELFHSFIHDLKTPMAAAKGAIDAATQFGPLTKRQEEMLQRAVNNLERMERMIHDALDFARLEMRQEVLREECHLPRLLEDAALYVEDIARQKGVHVVVQVATDAHPILGDSHLLNHVFNNLLSNAIKYNRTGGDVTVKAVNDGPMVRIDVRDTGVGIAPADVDRIFDRFYRVKRRGEKIDGTGLGLAIVKRIVLQHEGQVFVTSTPDEGSTFTVVLPAHSGTFAPVKLSTQELPDALDDDSQEIPDSSQSDSQVDDK
jgi:signal transduction histidine kinase